MALSAPQTEQLPMVNRRFEQIFHRDHKYCDCEMPMTSKKWNEALGTFVSVRLCCMAKAVEKIAKKLDIDVGSLYEVFDFEPGWEWDCNELHQCASEDGTVEWTERGVPPPWLLKRLRKKNIPVINLPE